MTTLPALTIERTDLAPAADIEATASYARNEKAPGWPRAQTTTPAPAALTFRRIAFRPMDRIETLGI
jgi:hypothetical protein